MLTVITPEIMEHLKIKYGSGKLRTVTNLYGSNIPEKYWFEKFDDKDLLDTTINDLKKGKDFFICCNDLYKANFFIADLLKELISSGKDVYRFNFSELISKYMDKGFSFNMEKYISDNLLTDVIAISDIIPGKYYQQYSHILENIITNTINSRMQKNIIIHIKKYDDMNQQSYISNYGEFMKELLFSERFAAVTEL